MIPGFSLIKNRIITPLLLASEKVVEYIIPNKAHDSISEGGQNNEKDMVEDSEKEQSNMDQKFQKLSLEDIERRQRKRTFKSLQKFNKNVTISKSLINKASDWVDFISERMPGESKVTRNFVTNMIELSDSALKRIAASCKGIESFNEELNLRFITPSKKFYNVLMSVLIKMDPTSIFSLSENAFIEHAKQALEREKLAWSEAYIEPTKAFFNIAKEEFTNLYKIQKDEAEDLDQEPNSFVFSMSRFFASIKTTLLEMWNSEIVTRSALFTSASISKESEHPWEASEEQKEEVE